MKNYIIRRIYTPTGYDKLMEENHTDAVFYILYDYWDGNERRCVRGFYVIPGENYISFFYE